MSTADLVPLEAVAREVAAEWGVTLGEPFALARYSYVAAAGDDAVLKVTPPEDDESDEEAEALELWAGDGAVRLLRRTVRRALLVERAVLETDIAELAEEEATARGRDRAGSGERQASLPLDRRPRPAMARQAERRGRGTSCSRLHASFTPRSSRPRDARPRGPPSPQHPPAGAPPGRDRPEADARRARVRRPLVPLESAPTAR